MTRLIKPEKGLGTKKKSKDSKNTNFCLEIQKDTDLVPLSFPE